MAFFLQPAVAQTDSTFTYQGELKDNGALAGGSFDMEFSLWDTIALGTQIGSPIPITGVQVTDGKFTVALDFGADSFDNANRWLEIVVQGSTLSPRVPINRSPYSIQTRGIFVDGNENVGIGTTAPEDSLHIKKQTTTPNLPERMLIVDSHDDPNNQDLQIGSGAGILFKVPYQFDSQVGAAIDAVRATNVELNSATDLVFSVSQNDEILTEAMRIDELGRVGLGTTTPGALLDMYTDTASSTNNSARFYAPNLGPKASHIHYGTRGDWYIRSADPTGFVFLQDDGGSVGIGTLNPFAKLGVNATSIPEAIGLNVTADTTVAPTIYATNQGSGPALWANGDVLMTGDIEMGPYAMHPAFAYGVVSADGSTMSKSSNVANISREGVGSYRISVNGGFQTTDVVLLTCEQSSNIIYGNASFVRLSSAIWVFTCDLADGSSQDFAFSFVVYRP